MAKKKISDKVIIAAIVQIKIARTGKLSGQQYGVLMRFQEALPPLIEEVQKKTANTFLELLQEFYDRERAAKKAAKLPSNEKIVKGKKVTVKFSGDKK